MTQLGESEALASRLVGYTTTGNFSLSRGCGFALGLITLSSWNKMVKVAEESGDGRGVLAKVRNNGGKICRLAKLEYV
jgi:ribonuclease P/MRP protein subunit POP1